MTAEGASPSQAAHALSIALQWAAEGFAVLPAEVFQQPDGTLGKVPRSPHGHHDATDDPHQLAKLFAGLTPQHGGVIAVGMVPASNDVIVIDVDVKNGKRGAESIKDAGLPPTKKVRTPSGGWHLWYRTKMVFGNASLWTDVDVRNGRGWVVAPGTYAPWADWEIIDDEPVADLPQHVEDKLLAVRSDDPSGDGDVRCLTGGEPCYRMGEAISAIRATTWSRDSRHDTMVRLQGLVIKLGDMGHPGAAEAIRILREAFDAAKPVQTPGEWSRALSGAVGKYGGSTEAPFCDCGPLSEDPMFQQADEDDDPLADPYPPLPLDELWQASEALRHIHSAARCRNRSELGVLAAALAIVSALTPYQVVLPPVVASPASVNLMVMLAAPPGSGKSAIASIAHELFGMVMGDGVKRGGWLLAPIYPGSGEGLIDTYLTRPDVTGHRDFKTRNGLLLVDEFSQMATQASRSGSTLLSTFRSMAHGEPSGMSNADESRRRGLGKNAYRFAAIVGVQPRSCDAILTHQQIDGGTPQRFVWVDVSKRPGGVKPEWPGELPIAEELIGQLQDAIQGCSDVAVLDSVVIDYPEAVKAYVAAMDNVAVDMDTLKQHMVLLRLKLSVAVARLHGRFDHFTEWDWRVAGTIWQSHMRTLDWVLGELRMGHSAANKAVGHSKAEQEVAKDDAVRSLRVTRIKARLLNYLRLSDEPLNKKQLKGRIRGLSDRAVIDDALDSLAADGLVVRHPGQRANTFKWGVP